jgi:hypothetical protein
MIVKHLKTSIGGEDWQANVEAVVVIDEQSRQIQFGSVQVKSTQPDQLNEVQSHALWLQGSVLVESLAKDPSKEYEV